LRAIRALREKGLSIPNDAVQEGLSSVTWPGRFEIVRRSPTVILDGAHNVAGAEALATSLQRLEIGPSRRHLILGVLKDKDAEGIATQLVPHFSDVVVVSSNSPRALPVAELARIVQKIGATPKCYDSVERAVRDGLASADADEAWVIAGSLTVVAEARQVVEELG